MFSRLMIHGLAISHEIIHAFVKISKKVAKMADFMFWGTILAHFQPPRIPKNSKDGLKLGKSMLTY